MSTLRARGDFQRVRAQGRRLSSGVTWCIFRADASLPQPRFAFALSRSVGSAVVRNRIRRRLRALLRQLPAPPGDYIVGAGRHAADLPSAELRDMVVNLLARAGALAAGSPS